MQNICSERMQTSIKLHKLLENSLKDLCIDGIIKPIEQIIEENEKMVSNNIINLNIF